jgi:galactokinase
MNKKIKISTPGRICLFGEHQDYLHLPVIASAISLRISIDGSRSTDKIIKINLPDINGYESFDCSGSAEYTAERDYFKSSFNVLLRNSYTFSSGVNCSVHGEIPINAGTSSSSALIVTWINFLTRMSDQGIVLEPKQLARLAYEAEVLEFLEPGGMMDQYTTAVGGIIALDFNNKTKVSPVNAKLKTFVLGNSNEPKDTKGILSRVKDQMIKVNNLITEHDTGFSLKKVKYEEIVKYSDILTKDQLKLLKGTIINRDITREARKELNNENPDHKKLGYLLNEHQDVLREVLQISTPKIDRMIKDAINAGAYGAKINGSGGGGCMFAYAPDNPEKVKKAIENVEADAFVIISDSGTRVDKVEGI